MHRIPTNPLLRSRIPSILRRLRPPNGELRQDAKQRLFNHKSQLLLVAPSVIRPQLPFLHPSSRPPLCKVTLQSQINRFLSTERRTRWKETIRWQLRFHAYFWPSCALLILLGAGIHQTKLERMYPTPREWSFWSRWFLRSAQAAELEEASKTDRVLVDWRRVGFFYKQLLPRLEDAKLDGTFLIEQAEGGILVDGVGKTGFDITMKSEPWRRGYHQALRGAAKAAEHLDGCVRDRTRNLIFPADRVIGPSNPRPKPMPFGHKKPPQEEDCEPAFDNPQVFYMRVLTTEGFSTRQRMDAALAYADWLDYKGLKDTAKSMYDWALDIASSGLPMAESNVVDRKTGVLTADATQHVSENLLKATTALGVHHASNGNVKAALPIFLGVLKARKELPPEPFSQEPVQKKRKQEDDHWFWAYYWAVLDWLSEAPYPPRPDPGNQRPFHTLKEACEEVGLVTYIGEILYATSSKEKGLSWTRDAVDAAEAVMWAMKAEDREEGRERCQECLKTGLENWKTMARSMAMQAEKKAQEAESESGWFGSAKVGAADQAKRWEEEEAQIELRIEKTIPLVNPLKPPPASFLGVSV